MIKKILFFLIFSIYAFAFNVTNQCGYLPSKIKPPYFPFINSNVNEIPFNFKCPSLTEIAKNPHYKQLILPILKQYKLKDLKKMNITTYLDNVNFINGSYKCVYYIKDTTFVLNLINKGCLKFNNDFHKLFPLNKINSANKLNMPNISVNKIGFYSFNDFFNLKSIYDDLYNKTLALINKLNNLINENKIPIIDLRNLNSHDNYDKTVPAFLINLLTLSPDYSKDNKLIDNFGNLIMNFPKEAYKNMKLLINLTNPDVQEGTAFNKVEDISKFVQNKNKMFNERFWGFYYVFFKNIEDGFYQIIAIIFLFGAFGLFGFALMQKKFDLYLIEDSQKFQFDFSKKFLSLAIPFILFTSPIITISNAKIPKQFLYNPQSQKNIDIYTPIQAGIRYSLNFGNYFGNLINDYATYAYLYYIANSVGYNLNPQSLIIQLNQDFTNFYYKFYKLKQKYDFYRTICVLSYPNIFTKFGHFPNNIKPYNFDNSGIALTNSNQQQLYNTFGFSQVKYNYCVFLENDIYARSIDLINSLNNYQQNYIDNLKRTNIKISKSVLESTTNLLKSYIMINNTFGWLTSAVVPSLETILTANNFLAQVDIDSLKDKINNEVIKYSDYSYKENGNNIKNYTNENDSSSSIENFLKRATQSVLSLSVYTILPGFNDLFHNTYKFLNNLLNGFIPNGLLSKFINFFVPKKFKTVILFISTLFICVFLYNLLVMMLTFMLITFALIIKIAFYFLEIFLTFLISFALSIWSLTVNPQKAWEAWGNFMFQIAKLTFMPIIIVLTSFSLIFINKLIKYLYAFTIYIIGSILNSASDLGYSYTYSSGGIFDILKQSWSHFHIFKILDIFSPLFSSISLNAFIGGSGGILLDIIILIVDLIIVFKLSDWVFEIFGKRDAGGMISGEIRQVGEGLKAKYSGGML